MKQADFLLDALRVLGCPIRVDGELRAAAEGLEREGLVEEHPTDPGLYRLTDRGRDTGPLH